MPEFKVCTACEERKAASEFYRVRTSADGLCSHCKTCYNAAQRRRHHMKRPIRLERKREYRQANRKRIAESGRRYLEQNRSQIYARRRARKRATTVQTIEAMLQAQDGKCAICALVFDVGSTARKGVARRPHIDHDHSTDEVRGLLCHGCNVGLGWFRDSPAALIAAAEYLGGPKVLLQKNSA
jgi:Recombination endonuclease VII